VFCCICIISIVFVLPFGVNDDDRSLDVSTIMPMILVMSLISI